MTIEPSGDSPAEMTSESMTSKGDQVDPSPTSSLNVPSSEEVETGNDSSNSAAILRQQPIPPPSEAMQYRAIGLIRGRYKASPDQFTKGTIFTTEGTEIDAVLLGRVMSLVKKHLDLEQEHLWVVYPRTRERENNLHAQIVGVWEPEKLNKDELKQHDDSNGSSSAQESVDLAVESDSTDAEIPGFTDDYFSIRGEVIYASQDEGQVIVKIRQSSRKESDQEKAFKLQLQGVLSGKVLGHFWNLDVQRQNNALVIQSGTAIGMLPPKKKSQRSGDRRRDSPPPRRQWDSNRDHNRPQRPTGLAPRTVPTPSATARKEPLPKPVKRKTVED